MPWLDAEFDVDFGTAINHGMFPSSGRAVRVRSFGKFREITSTLGLIVCSEFGKSVECDFASYFASLGPLTDHRT